MAQSGVVLPATVISVTPPPQAQAPQPPPPPGPPPFLEPEQEQPAGSARIMNVQQAAYVTPQPQSTVTQVPLTTAAPEQPGVYTPSPVQACAAPAAQPANAQIAQTAQVAPQASAPQLMQLQVLVPAPGVAPGQQLAFPAPMGPGQPSKQMVVTVQQGANPGAVVTVQYPLPTSTFSAPGRVLPQTTLTVNTHADQNGMIAGWILFASGWCCLCVFPPMGLLFFGIGAALYFCKPPQQRAGQRQSRAPAYANLLSCLTCLILALLFVLGMSLLVMSDPNDFPVHHHHGHHGPRDLLHFMAPHHHHWQHPRDEHAPWTWEKDSVPSHHKPCPMLARIKAVLQGVRPPPGKLTEMAEQPPQMPAAGTIPQPPPSAAALLSKPTKEANYILQ